MIIKPGCLAFAAGALVVWLLVIPAAGADNARSPGDTPSSFSLRPVEVDNVILAQAETPSQPTDQTTLQREEVRATETTEPALPLRIALSYGLYSDYVWRARNLSEYTHEAREKPNHQMNTSIAWITKEFGTFGFDTFFEWYAAQRMVNPYAYGDNLQEVDFVIWWSYPIQAIATDVRLSYTYDIFPNQARRLESDAEPGNNNDDRTQYWTMILTHNDAWMWKWLWPENEGGILNPTFLFSHDFGTLAGVWMEFGFSHPFPVPGIDNLTITPGWKIFTDCNYWSPGFKLAGDQWALVAAYDLTPILQLPKWAGRFVIQGELYFNNAFGTMEDNDVLHDEFWGGTSVHWIWGG
jgi:hypothetical protein